MVLGLIIQDRQDASYKGWETVGHAEFFRCILAMGLDKKPNPPPKRLKEDRGREESVTSPKDSPEMQTQMNGENSASRSECESGRPLDTQAQLEERTAAVEGKVRDGTDTVTVYKLAFCFHDIIPNANTNHKFSTR